MMYVGKYAYIYIYVPECMCVYQVPPRIRYVYMYAAA